jgi:hypothetical protein
MVGAVVSPPARISCGAMDSAAVLTACTRLRCLLALAVGAGLQRPHEDFDLVRFGVVKVLEDRLGHTYPDMAWEPKAAFTALADRYRG